MAWVDYNDAIKKAIANIKAYETEQKRLSAQSDMWMELAKGTEGYGDTLELLIPKVTDVEEEHQTLFESIEKDIKDANASLWELIGTYDRWVVSQRGGITDVSGTQQPPGGDAAAAMRRLAPPVDISNNRRSYATSPRGDHRGTQSNEFLGIPAAKVQEFEQVTDISIDVLDEFSAQTKHTAAELEALRQNELTGFRNSLFDIINVIGTLDASNFGVSDSTGKAAGTFGKLAGAVASGNPIALLAAPFQIYNDMMNEHHENVKKIFADERELRRKGIEEEQRELDAYTAQRKRLFAARMDFLQHGESTFSDWTDTLESFAGNDLVRGQQVFASFSEAMDAVNNEVNKARLKLKPLVNNITVQNRIHRGTQDSRENRHRPRLHRGGRPTAIWRNGV